MLATAALHGDIDATLGPPSERYFGEGYRRVERRLEDIEPVDGADGRVERLDAAASVSYPVDWSSKRGSNLRPHLSTVDALLLSVDMAHAYLLACGLAEDAVPALWLHSARMRSGTAPLEELARFPVSARPDPTVTGSILGSRLVGFTCTVGKIVTRLQVAVPLGGVDLDLHAPRLRHPVPLPATRFRDRAHDIRGVSVEQGALAVRAFVEIRNESSAAEVGREFGDHYQPSLEPVDALTILAQLAQVLIYEQDRMRRSGSNTLWMRTFAVTARCPVQPYPPGFLTRVEMYGTRLLEHGGGRWRVADLGGDLLGMHAEASVAHVLPADLG